MTCFFDITAATNSVRLDEKRQGEAAFTVFNRSGRPVRGRVQLAPPSETAAAWLKLAGGDERSFATAGTEQYTVALAVPPDTPAGSYTFRLDMVGVENPDEEYCTGPTVTFEVPAPAPRKRFSKKLVSGLVAAVFVIGASTYALWPRPPIVPTLLGLTVADAQATLEAEGLVAGELVEGNGGEVEPGFVFATTPGPGTPIAYDAPVNLMVAGVSTPTPTSVPTSTPVPTATPDLAATATAAAQAAAAATDVAMTAEIGKYLGSWEVSGDGFPYITRFTVTRAGTQVTVTLTGSAFVLLTNGGLASGTCVGGGECTWGAATLAYDDDPLHFVLASAEGLTQEVTLAAVDAGTLSLVYRVSARGTTLPDMLSLFKRARFRPPRDILLNPALEAAEVLPYIVMTPVPEPILVEPNFDIRRLQP